MSEWIPVIDDFIKIGLPSIVTGVTAWHIAKYQARSNIDKFKFEKKNELLLSAAETYEAYVQSYLRFANLLAGLANAEHKFQNPPPEVEDVVVGKIQEYRERATNYRKQMNENMHQVFTAQAKLMFLGEENCQKRGDELQTAIFEADSSFKFNGLEYDLSSFMEKQEKVAMARKEFYEALKVARLKTDG